MGVLPESVELRKAENPWKPACLDPELLLDAEAALEKRTLGLLNRVSPQNLSNILVEFLQLVGGGESIVVRILFTKAIQEPLYCHIYR